MCLAVPVKVLSVNGEEAEVDIGGVNRTISIMLTPEARPGDYVLMHTGYAISTINEEEARQTLELFEQILASGDEIYC
jgi:hydrogenase expression/formation protein HypC